MAARGGGIRSTVAATAAGSLGELVDAARERARRMLLLGTTTVEVKSGYGQTLAAELRQLEAARSLAGEPGLPDVIPTYLPLHGPVDGDRAEYLEVVLRDGLPAAAGRASFVDCFCEIGAWSVEECERLLTAGRAAGLGAKVHAEQRSHSGGRRWPRGWGPPPPTTWITPPTATCVASRRRGLPASSFPGRRWSWVVHPPPGRRLLEAGVTLALATDCNPGTCWCEFDAPHGVAGGLDRGPHPGRGAAGRHRRGRRRPRARPTGAGCCRGCAATPWCSRRGAGSTSATTWGPTRLPG